jgi:hypothetical protein
MLLTTMQCIKRGELARAVFGIAQEMAHIHDLEVRCLNSNDMVKFGELEPIIAETMRRYYAAMDEFKQHVTEHQCLARAAAR